MKENVLETLEFDQIREKLRDMAPSALSKELAMSLVPSSVPEIVDKKLEETEEATILLEREITTPLGETYDIREILRKAKKDMILTGKEFMDLAASLETYKKMHHYFEGERHLLYPALEELSSLIISQEQLITRIGQVFDEHGEISDRASPKLSRIRTEKEMIKNRIRKTFQQIITDKDQSGYFQDAIVTQRNGRYVVPVKEEYRYKFDGIVHDRSSTGQTLFMEPMVSVRLNNDLAELTAAEKQEIQEILRALTEQVKKSSEVTQDNCKLATELEFIFARAKLALSMQGVRAVYSAKGILDLRNARHPLIDPKKVVPISMTLGKDFQILIITGSNAGGKTIAIKTAGLLALMNQSGLFIPAAEGSTLPLYQNMYAIIGDEQSIQYNLSTFSSYITQLVSFLSSVGPDDLVLLDELGSGTDPVEGAALAQSVTEYLQMQGTPAIITSHFSEMKKLAYETRGIENAFVEFDEETLTPTYHLIIGVAGNSNAFSICKRLGMPALVLSRASQLKEGSPLHNMEEVMARLNQQSREVAHEKEAVLENLKQAEELRNELKAETANFYKKKDAILEKTRAEAESIKRDLRNQSEAIIKDLKKKASDLAKDDLNNHIAGVRGKIDKMKLPGKENRRNPVAKEALKKGLYVYIDTLDSDGVITKVAGNKITVSCGLMNVTVTPGHCFETKQQKPKQKKSPVAHFVSHATSSVRTIHTTVNVIGKTVDEAIPEVDRFLNDCFLSGVSPVTIIHGKGTGKLRQGIHEYLRGLTYIKEFHEADPRNGGAGATEVFF